MRLTSDTLIKKHKYNNKPFWFTLVELIVVITILVILWTIAFTSLWWYSSSARDSSRVSDLTNLSKALEITYQKMSSYPDPDNLFAVTYSGWLVWAQWTIGNTTINLINAWWGVKMNKKPTDPLVPSKEYSYSKLAYGNGYQLKSDWEGDSLTFGNTFLFPQAQAAPSISALAYVKGNYNGIVAKTQTGNTVYIIAVPSIISGTGTVGWTLKIESNTLSGSLIIHGGSSLTGAIYNPKVVYASGAIPTTTIEKMLFASGIANAYSGTSLASKSQIQPFVTALSSNNTGSLVVLWGSIVFGGMTIDTSKIPVPSNDFTVVSCPTGKTAQNWSATKAQILSNITNYIWCRISWYDGDTPFITGKTNANNDILLTSATDISASQVWGCSSSPGVWVSAQSSVDGKANTLAIVNHSCSNSNTAAELCYNKWTWNIWYLPASSELNLFYTNLKTAWLWTFAAYYYWTSTEYSSDISASQNFVDGAIHSGLHDKTNPFPIRCASRL